MAVKVLLNYQVDCLLRDDDNWTALDIARTMKNNDLVVEILIAAEQWLFKEHYRIT